MDIIRRNKVKLIKWLSADKYILQHVQSRELITLGEYTRLKSISDPGTQITDLLDLMLNKGPGVCLEFLDMLKEDDVNESSPELKDWIKFINTSESKEASPSSVQSSAGCSVNFRVTGGSLCTPIVNNSQISSLSMNVNMGPQQRSDEKLVKGYDRSSNNNPRIPDIKGFLRKNKGALIDKVKNVDRIVDDLTTLTGEKAAIVRAQRTDQAKMRTVLDYTTSTTAAQLLITALNNHAADVMEDLTTA